LCFQQLRDKTPQSARSVVWHPACLIFAMMNNKKDDKEQEWRKLCDLIAREPDPKRLSQLVDQLIQELDGRTRSLRQTGQPQKPADK
jgi:hypothetical protein